MYRHSDSAQFNVETIFVGPKKEYIQTHSLTTRVLSYCNHTCTAAKLCTATVDVMNASRAVRGDIKALVISVQASKTDAHKKITDSISRNVQDARTRKVNMFT